MFHALGNDEAMHRTAKRTKNELVVPSMLTYLFFIARDVSRWLLSVFAESNETKKSNVELKLLLPLATPLPSSATFLPLSPASNYHSLQITSSRTLYYSIAPTFHPLVKDDLCGQLRQVKFPQAYALFLKDLSRLIKPAASSNLSIDLIWELMPDVDEHQRLLNESYTYSLQHQQHAQIINNLIPDMWGEIGR